MARYTHNLAIDDPLGLEKGGKLHAYHKDTLGSIRAITDSTQTIINSYSYDSFGNTTQTGTLSQPYAYTGRELDKETGLYYYRARYYDPVAGRFIQRDPISFAGGDVNLYGYVQNNPINWVDPFGLTLQPPSSPPVNDPNWYRYPNRNGEELFHCGYTCFLEKRKCTGDSCVKDPVGEACYDEKNKLVDDKHPYCNCKGTPDQYPQDDWFNHTFNDSGGIYKNGWDAFWESQRQDREQRYPGY